MSLMERVDPFLEEIAVQNAIQAALQRSRTYRTGNTDSGKEKFRAALVKRLRQEAERYAERVSESEHYAALQRICDGISQECQDQLADGKLRYGIAQKAFNLYLKFLWKLGAVELPPHCPIDSIVLKKITNNIPYTRFSIEDYKNAVEKLKQKAKARGMPLSEWENKVWLNKIRNGRQV
jgi:hypothetical protein